jgi:hypothetical protein
MSWIEYLRSFRIANMAVFDWVMTFVAAAAIGLWMGWPIMVIFVILLLISIPVHILFGVHTYTNYYLGLNYMP